MLHIESVYTVIFEGFIFQGRQVLKDFRDLIFAVHQVEYIVSLSHYFFLRIKFCAQQAYSEIQEIYILRKLLHIRMVCYSSMLYRKSESALHMYCITSC